MEINAMFRNQMFGIKSEEAVPDTYFRPNPSEQIAFGSPTVSPTNSSSKDDVRTTILNAMRSTPDIKIEKLAQLCNLSEEGVRYHIKKLKKEGYVKIIRMYVRMNFTPRSGKEPYHRNPQAVPDSLRP